MKRACAIGAFALAALPSIGASQDACLGAGTPLFYCTFDGGQKEVRLCLQAGVVLYSFGKSGRTSDMVLGRAVEGVEMTPWNGVGRSIWEEVRIYNNIYSYILSYAIDRTGEMPVDARLIVAEGEDAQLAELVCDAGSVSRSDFYPIYEAKEAAGQLYCADTYSWGVGC